MSRAIILLVVVGLMAAGTVAPQAEQAPIAPDNIVVTAARVITHRGILKDNTGQPVGDGNYNLTFRLYEAPSGGSLFWISGLIQVQTVGGYFKCELGPIDLPFENTYYLSVQVQGDSEMSERQKLTAVPTASAPQQNVNKVAPQIGAYLGSANPAGVETGSMTATNPNAVPPMPRVGPMGFTATNPNAAPTAQQKEAFPANKAVEETPYVGAIAPSSGLPADKKQHVAPPPNPNVILQGGDNVGSATVIPGLPYSDVGTTVGYTDDYDAICPYNAPGSPDVVYSYTPGSNENVEITLCENSDYDTKLYVFENSVGNVIACNDDFCTTPSYPSPYVSFLDNVALTAGNTYYIVVDGYGGSAGDYTFDMEMPPICDVVCPPEGILEGEPDCGDEYVDNYNGGCDSSPWVFQDITPGDVICAESGTYLYQGLYYRDTDWFRVVFAEATPVDWKGVAEFPLRLFVISDPAENCAITILGMGDALPCDTARVHVNVPAGTYYMWAGPQVFTGWPCPLEYVAEFMTWPVPPCIPDFSMAAPFSNTSTTCGAGDDCALRGGEDHIYEIAIPYDATWIFTLCNTSPSWDTYMFLGTACCSGDIAYNDDYCGVLSQITAALTAGTYYLDIEPYSNGTCGDYQLDVYEVPPGPPNDNCVDATPDPLADGQTLTYTGNNTSATVDCPLLGFPEVWFAFTTSEVLNVTVDMCTSPTIFSTVGVVYTLDCPCTNSYFFNNWEWTTCGEGNPTLYLLNLPPGTYYYPLYSAPPENGDYVVHISAVVPPPPPPNDNCQDVIPVLLVAGAPLQFVGDNTGATVDCPGLGAPEAWEAITTTECMDVTIDYCGTDPYFNNAFIVIDDACPCDGAWIFANNYDNTSCPDGLNWTVRYTALPAGTYWIPILTAPGAQGPYVMNVNGVACPPPPPSPCDGAYYTNHSVPQTGAWPSQCDPVYPFQAGMADDFILPGTGDVDVNQVNLWVGLWNGPGDPGNVTSVGVTIYADNGGMPGGHPSGYDPACSHVDDMGGVGIISEQMINPPEFTFVQEPNGTYQLLIPITPVTLTAGITYWLEVAPVMEFMFGGQVGWTPGDLSTGYPAMAIFDLLGITNWDASLPGGIDLAFCLLAQPSPGCIYVLGDINGDGDATPWSDINYAIAYFKGMGPPPQGECPNCACDVNCNGLFNAIDIVVLFNYWKGVGDLCYFAPDCPPPQPDPQGPPDGPDSGLPDTIIIGNLDLTPTVAHPGDTVEIPIWVRNDEDVGALNMAISADDAFITEWLGGTLQEPLTQWDDCGFSDPAPDQQMPGHTVQAVNGWSDLDVGHNPPLNTDGNFTQVSSIRFLVSANVALSEDTTQLVPGDIERLHLSAFSDPLGAQEWPPQIIGGLLVIFPPEGCEYIPGDINSTGEANGVDVQYAVNYFKGYGDPPLVVCPGCADQGEDLFGAGDVNGTCEFNGVDVQYFVNYLKGLFDPEDTLTFCPNCPPAGR